MVYTVRLRDVHLVHLQKTPFWLLFEAILINQLDHTEFKKGNDLVVNIIQSYSVREGKLVISGCGVDVIDEGIRLLFGLRCGHTFLNLTPRPRPASDFVQHRCHGTSPITAKLVSDLLVEAAAANVPGTMRTPRNSYVCTHA